MPPGNGIHCPHCGTNLLWRRRLPTRRQWQARPGAQPASQRSSGGALRYTPGDLDEMHIGSRQAKRGRLTLVLTLSEELEADELLEHVVNAKESTVLACWLAVTSKRLLCIPSRAAAFSDRGELRSWDLGEIHDLRHRHYLLDRSRFTFRTAKRDRVRLRMQGKETASRLVDCLRTQQGAKPTR
jgi:hypothetical protein